MYKHFLVPLDGTTLSALNTSQAVLLAKKLGAHISFFYATPNFGATDEGAMWRNIDPNFYEEQTIGDSRAILAKAAADATAQGVSYELHARIADRPAQAILDAAQELACDLIVMASRGERGLRSWLHGSQTEMVLRTTHLPLLVTRVAANEPLSNAERALGLIYDEHRSLAVVINGMRDLVHQAVDNGHAPDLPSLSRMLQYLHDFPEKLHHPKEEQYIHARLLQRHMESRAVIDELEQQHQAEYKTIARINAAFADCTANKAGSVSLLVAEIDGYAQGIWKHMTLEESTLLPMATQYLEAEDWREIAQAFENNNDPHFGDLTKEAFKRLFTRITNFVPKKTVEN